MLEQAEPQQQTSDMMQQFCLTYKARTLNGELSHSVSAPLFTLNPLSLVWTPRSPVFGFRLLLIAVDRCWM